MIPCGGNGLLIKLRSMGIGGRLDNWIMDFLTGRKIRVKVGSDVSMDVGNGIPQVSAISPVLFNIMINYIFLILWIHQIGTICGRWGHLDERKVI